MIELHVVGVDMLRASSEPSGHINVIGDATSDKKTLYQVSNIESLEAEAQWLFSFFLSANCVSCLSPAGMIDILCSCVI